MRLLKVVIAIVLLIGSAMVFAVPAEDVTSVNDRDYFGKVHALMKNAKESVYVIMFSAYYYDKHPDSPSNALLQDLADANKKGLKVKVILEQGEPLDEGFFGKKKLQPEQHNRVTEFLKEHNVSYVLDSPSVTTHSKLIIVDSEYTVIGSMNWSFSALEKNHESTVIIKSKEIAREYEKYFNNIAGK